MEIQNDGEELQVRKADKGEPVPESTYEVEFVGYSTFMRPNKYKNNDEVKTVSLRFKILSGNERGKVVKAKGNMSFDRVSDSWYVSDKAKLARWIAAITGGGERISNDFIGKKVYVEVKNWTNPEDSVTWDYVTDVLKHPESIGKPKAKAPAAAKPAATKETVTSVVNTDTGAAELESLEDFA